MKTLTRYALSAGAVIASLQGCAGSQLPIRAPGAASSNPDNVFTPNADSLIPSTVVRVTRDAPTPDYKVSGSLLYVTNFDSPPYDGVTIYAAGQNNPSPIAVINSDVSQPNGDCIDAGGTLYVSNDPGSSLGWVSEYALGTTKALRVITTGISIPSFCAIDSSGNLWVTNVGGPTVTEYLKGSTTPNLTLTNGLTNPDGIGIDRSGTVYVGNLNAPYAKSNVEVYPPGKKSPSRTITDGVSWPVGIAVDPQGTLYVTNDTSPCNIEEYRTGESHPFRTIMKDMDGPTAVTFAPSGRFYEVNAGVVGCTGNGRWPVILEFRPHSLSPSRRMISNDLHVPVGAAYYPPLLP